MTEENHTVPPRLRVVAQTLEQRENLINEAVQLIQSMPTGIMRELIALLNRELVDRHPEGPPHTNEE